MQLLNRMLASSGLLLFTSSKYGLQNYRQEDVEMIRRCHALLRHLREVEHNPRTWHEGGFLNKIDNYLAVLLYRREPPPSAAPGYVRRSRTRSVGCRVASPSCAPFAVAGTAAAVPILEPVRAPQRSLLHCSAASGHCPDRAR